MINFKTLKESKMKFFDFEAFQNKLQMPSHEKTVFSYLLGYFILIPVYFNFKQFLIFNPSKVHVQEDMLSPAETHDQCNRDELNPELKCDLINRYLTCRPRQCETGNRFRCDCSVYE